MDTTYCIGKKTRRRFCYHLKRAEQINHCKLGVNEKSEQYILCLFNPHYNAICVHTPRKLVSIAVQSYTRVVRNNVYIRTYKYTYIRVCLCECVCVCACIPCTQCVCVNMYFRFCRLPPQRTVIFDN